MSHKRRKELSVIARNTYTNLLSQKGHGLAIWDPELRCLHSNDTDTVAPPELGEVEIGDVGIVDGRGGFLPLFNVMRPPSDPKNATDGLPEHFEQLKFNRRLLISHRVLLQPGPVAHAVIYKEEVGGELGGGVDLANASAALSFTTQSNQGALLYLQDPARAELVETNTAFPKYMHKHYDRWLAHMAKYDLGTESDLFLVRGYVKTTQWAVFAYTEGSGSQEFFLNAKAANLATAQFKFSDAMSFPGYWESNVGPSNVLVTESADLKSNQTVFLSYYRLRRRFLVLKKIEAHAGDAALPDDEGEGPGEEALTDAADINTRDTQINDPVGIVLDYILRYAQDAEVAIASDGDIIDLLGPPTEELPWPEDLADYLSQTLPKIEVDENKVGTLSIEDAILRQNTRHEDAMAAQAQQEAQEFEDAQVAAALAATAAVEAAEAGQDGAEQGTGTEYNATLAEVPGTQNTDQEGAAPGGTPATPAIDPNPPDFEDDDMDAEWRDRFHSDGYGSSKVVPDNLRGSSIILGKDPEGFNRTIEWPHQVLYDIAAEGGAVCSYSISKDGRYLAAGFEDSFLRIWNTQTSAVTHKITHHSDTVWAVAFSPTESTRLASGSGDKTAIIYDIGTREIIHAFDAHDGDVWTLAYSPDGNTLATGCVDGAVRLFDVNSGNLLYNLQGLHGVVMFLSFSADGTRLLSGADRMGRIWNPISGEAIGVIESHEGALWGMSFSPQGDRILTNSDDCTARAWSSENIDELVIYREHTGAVWAAAWSPDGKNIVTGSFDQTLAISESFEGGLVRLLRDRPSVSTSVAWSKDGDFIASGSADGSIKLWEAETGVFVAELRGHKDKVKGIGFTSDGSKIVSSSDDGTIRLWSIVNILRL